MNTELNYLSAFLVALLGGVHCFGMCGGIVGALTLGLADDARRRFTATLPFLLAYNAGRITSYTVAGLLAGGLGGWAAGLTSVRYGQEILMLIAALFMIALGLYLGGWWQGLSRLEQAGGRLWRYLEPAGRRLLPVRTPVHALGVGLIWGWLPCGLVYSMLVWAMSAGSAAQGALLMLSFGLGTLPALLAMGVFAATIARVVRNIWWRRLAGALVIVFGVYQLSLLRWPL